MTTESPSDIQAQFTKDLSVWTEMQKQEQKDYAQWQTALANMLAALKSGHVEQALMMASGVLGAASTYHSDATGLIGAQENISSDLRGFVANMESNLAQANTFTTVNGQKVSAFTIDDAQEVKDDVMNLWADIGNGKSQPWATDNFIQSLNGPLGNVADRIYPTGGAVQDWNTATLQATIVGWASTNDSTNMPYVQTQLESMNSAVSSNLTSLNTLQQYEITTSNEFNGAENNFFTSTTSLEGTINKNLGAS